MSTYNHNHKHICKAP